MTYDEFQRRLERVMTDMFDLQAQASGLEVLGRTRVIVTGHIQRVTREHGREMFRNLEVLVQALHGAEAFSSRMIGLARAAGSQYLSEARVQEARDKCGIIFFCPKW